jgi:hypothetical protein
MTDQHPVLPSSDLIGQWIIESDAPGQDVCEGVAIYAARWGADQEFEAIIDLIKDHEWFADPSYRIAELRAARRPKPPSLKQQALEAMRGMQIEPCILDGVNTNAALQAKYDIIIRALEALPND